ncbi:hypothetical protein IAR50_002879 [Cryptococcus sp. DSM 104548]
MAPLTHDFPTFGHYAHNLKDGLHHTASKGLNELEQAIETKGYDWLEGYMAQIFDRLPQAPIGELIKTPSKTQTVKKTRAAIAAAKEKTEKIKGLNARLALSPPSQVNRPALSPLHLGARSVNINTSPSPSPIKSKPAKPLAASSPAKSKAKRGRTKKAEVVNDGNPVSVADATVKSSQGEEKSSAASRKGNIKKLAAIESEMASTSSRSEKTKETKSKSVRSKKAEKQPERAPEEAPVQENMDIDEPASEPKSKSTRSKKAAGKQVETEAVPAVTPQALEEEAPVRQESPVKSTRSRKADKQAEVVEPFVPVEQVEQAPVNEEQEMINEPEPEAEAQNVPEEPTPAPAVAEEMETEVEPVDERPEKAVEMEEQGEEAEEETVAEPVLAIEEGQQAAEEPDVQIDVQQEEEREMSEPSPEVVSPEATEPEAPQEPVKEKASEPIVDETVAPVENTPAETEATAPSRLEALVPVQPEAETETEVIQAPATDVISESAPTNVSQTSSTSNPQPAHRVRSSWLSKALGAGAPPFAHAHESSVLRKSHAASSQPDRANMDFSGLRKSLAPIGGLKRKSNEGLGKDEDEEEDEDNRPGKVAKASEAHTIHFPTTTPGPAKASLFPTKTPSSYGTASVGSDQHSQGRPVQDDSQRPEISRVTKALDELREKTAKDLAKQKATPAAGPAPRVPQAKSTGAGFLRGLLNFGGGSVESGEDEATRRARELEEEKIAEEELEKLMWAARNGVDEDMILGDEEEQEPAAAPQAVQKEEPRSTTPSFSPPPKPTLRNSIHPAYMSQPSTLPPVVAPAPEPPVQAVPAGTLTDNEDEEMVDEESVLDEIIPEDITEYQPSNSQTSSQGQHTRFFSPAPASTTPVKSLEKEAPALHDRKEKHQHEPSAAVLNEQREQKDKDRRREEREQEKSRLREEKEREREKKGKDKSAQQAIEVDEEITAPVKSNHRKTPSASQASLFTSTSATNSTLNHASTMAAKALGVKPAAAPVKSLQQAASAAQKEQAASVRKAALREQTDKRKEQLAQKKADEERVRAEEERKAKVAELEEKRRIRAEGEKRRKEREVKAKEKAAKEQADEAAKVKQAEAEAAKKRKLAAALSKSQSAAPAPKRVAAPSQSLTKGKEPFRPTKTNLSSSITADSKMGPNTFRTAESQAQSSTIKLVSKPVQPPAQRESQVTWPAPERKPLGQPSRPSQMEGHGVKQSLLYQAHHQQLQSINAQPQAPPQNWQQVQASLDKKVQQQDSEDIVLPDIASEYSDPDDDTTRDFNRPDWAESPALNKALAAQATIDPDEYFGHIGPLNMEELFKARAGKFRPRSSSANWSRGDGLTPMEIIDYAKRMGYESLQSYDDGPGPSGSS